MEKQCTKCKEVKLLSDFSKNKSKSTGYNSVCKQCHRIYDSKRRVEKRDQLLENSKRYYQENKEKCSEKSKEYRERNKESIREYKKDWYDKNKDHVLEQRKEYYIENKDTKVKEYRKSNKDHINEMASQYRKKNPERMSKRKRKYYLKNKDRILEEQKEYRKSNKEHMRKYAKQYYLDNKDIIKERVYDYRKDHTIESQQWRYSKECQRWKKRVYLRDNHTCQDCGKTHCPVHAHHIKSAKDYPELRYDISNGVCLCVECHKAKHSINV